MGLVTVLSARPVVRVLPTGSSRKDTNHGGITVVVGGIDTHADTHTLAVIDVQGRLLGTTSVPATAAGNRQALAWLTSHGQLDRVGVEGTGSYGAQLARYLTTQDVDVVEVDRADRKQRRQRGKSDPLDAEAAARAVLAGTATTTPKTRTGPVESLSALKATKRAAMKAMVAARSALVQLVITAPQPVRDQLDGLTGTARVQTCARLRPDRTRLHEPEQAVKLALRRTARRCMDLAEETAEADADIEALVKHTAPKLLDHFGADPDRGAQQRCRLGRGVPADRVSGLRGLEVPVDRGRAHRQQLGTHRLVVAAPITLGALRCGGLRDGRPDQLTVGLQQVQLDPHRGRQVLPALPTAGSPDLPQHQQRVIGVTPAPRLPFRLGHRPARTWRCLGRCDQPAPGVVTRPAGHRHHLVQHLALVLLGRLHVLRGVPVSDLGSRLHRQPLVHTR